MTFAALPLFQLAPLPKRYPRDPSDASPSLPIISPRFILPSLDEHAAGSDPLLQGLNSGIHDFTTGYSDLLHVKGRRRETQEDDQVEPSKDAPVVGNVWDHMNDVAGLSRQRTFDRIRTWDVLNEPHDSQHSSTPFVSESSPLTFDALATSLEPPLSLPKIPDTVPPPPHDSETLLSLMIRSTLGTTTTEHLKWNRLAARFQWDFQGGRLRGMGNTASVASIEGFLNIATAIRRLEIMMDAHSSTPLTPTHHALLHAVSTYLTLLKTRLSGIISTCGEDRAAWHKSAMGLRDTRQLVELLCQVMCWPITQADAEGLPSKASSLLTHLHSYLLAHLSSSTEPIHPPTTICLAFLLSQSSGPFLSLLHAWLGLSPSSADEDLDEDSQPWADLGITRSKLPSSESGDLRWSYGFQSRRIPSYVPYDSRWSLFEAGRSLRLLREASGGQHPLCAGCWELKVGWGWGAEEKSSSFGTIHAHVRRVKREIDHWRRSIKYRSKPLSGSAFIYRQRGSRKERKALPVEFMQSNGTTSSVTPNPALHSQSEHAVDQLWTIMGQSPGSHFRHTSSDQSPLFAPTPLSNLDAFIAHHSNPLNALLPVETPTLSLFISNTLLAPLLTHAKLVSTSLVSLYLDDLHLLDHYDVLRAFFLGEDVGFNERVSGALFGKDEAGAGEAVGLGRRARTRARLGLGGDEGDEDGAWGIGLGLGLSERARWPPGGAELAYALRTTLLNDDDVGGGGEKSEKKRSSPVWQSVEDRVSFAVRALPEDQKDGKGARWLDPQAIEALDFLYLSYSPPTSIALLFPSTIMVKHQKIHNLILRICRVKSVLRSLYFDATHQSRIFEEPIKRGVDLGSKMTRKSTTTHQTDADRLVHGVLPKGSKVERNLQRLRFRMSTFVMCLERYIIDTAIGSNWGIMRRRLERLGPRKPGSEDDSRLNTPLTDREDDNVDYFEQVGHDHHSTSPIGDEADKDDDGDPTRREGYGQLHSIHSLIEYHHLIIDRILRATLLSPNAGHQVTFKVLMGLFGLILDLGKVVKEMKRGVVGWEDGADRVEEISADWQERDGVFLHALERLSLRTTRTNKASGSDDQSSQTGQGDEHDLRLLLDEDRGGQGGEEDEDRNVTKGASGRMGGDGRTGDGGNLGELLIRLTMASTGQGGRGRWKKDEAV